MIERAPQIVTETHQSNLELTSKEKVDSIGVIASSAIYRIKT